MGSEDEMNLKDVKFKAPVEGVEQTQEPEQQTPQTSPENKVDTDNKKLSKERLDALSGKIVHEFLEEIKGEPADRIWWKIENTSKIPIELGDGSDDVFEADWDNIGEALNRTTDTPEGKQVIELLLAGIDAELQSWVEIQDINIKQTLSNPRERTYKPQDIKDIIYRKFELASDILSAAGYKDAVSKKIRALPQKYWREHSY